MTVTAGTRNISYFLISCTNMYTILAKRYPMAEATILHKAELEALYRKNIRFLISVHPSNRRITPRTPTKNLTRNIIKYPYLL